MQIYSVGIDLGKTTFHLVALGTAGKVLVRKKFNRKQLLVYTANIPASLIGLEACSGAHFLGRALRKQGHDVRLIPAQFVKPFVKSNKNDFIDAEAIAEAVERKNMRFVPIKTDDQLDLQAIHRVRDRLISRRTAVINQLRAFLLERGLVFAQTPAKLKAVMADVLEGADAHRTPQIRNLMDILWSEWKTVEQQIKELTEQLERISDADAGCTRIRKALLPRSALILISFPRNISGHHTAAARLRLRRKREHLPCMERCSLQAALARGMLQTRSSDH